MLQQNVSIKLSKRIWRTYYLESLSICQSNPYQLIGVVSGVTFETADQLSMKNPKLKQSKERFSAAVIDVFAKNNQTANVWMSMDLCVLKLKDCLNE